MPESSISDNSKVYRAILYRWWTNENNEVAKDAFLLKDKDDGELSVLSKADCVARICSGGFNTCFGEIVLKAGKIRGLGLEIKPDPLPHSPYHVIILNLPLPQDIRQAEEMATLLSEGVESIQRKSEKYSRKQP